MTTYAVLAHMYIILINLSSVLNSNHFYITVFLVCSATLNKTWALVVVVIIYSEKMYTILNLSRRWENIEYEVVQFARPANSSSNSELKWQQIRERGDIALKYKPVQGKYGLGCYLEMHDMRWSCVWLQHVWVCIFVCAWIEYSTHSLYFAQAITFLVP